MSAEDIINAAKFAWDVFKDGKPSGDIQSSTANAVPHVDDWSSLTNAQGPNSYRMHYSMGYVWPFDDYDHVQFTILLKWDFGARYRNGGAYIPNIWIEVPDEFIGWGWSANIAMHVQNPTNAGSATAPLARIPVSISGTVTSGLESYRVEWPFVLFGDGTSTQG